MASQSLLLLLASAMVMLQTTRTAPTTYSGDWLAQQLDMNTPEGAQAALKSAIVTPVRSTAQASRLTPEEVARAEQRRQAYKALMVSGRKEEALKLIDNLIEQNEADDTRSSRVQLAYLRYDRLWALKLMNRYIEALVELQRLRQLLAKLGEPLGKLGEMAWRMEQELENLGDFQKLQLAQGASKSDIRKSYKRLMMLLHPDKINTETKLDETTKTYVSSLYDKVRAAYDTLISS